MERVAVVGRIRFLRWTCQSPWLLKCLCQLGDVRAPTRRSPDLESSHAMQGYFHFRVPNSDYCIGISTPLRTRVRREDGPYPEGMKQSASLPVSSKPPARTHSTYIWTQTSHPPRLLSSPGSQDITQQNPTHHTASTKPAPPEGKCAFMR